MANVQETRDLKELTEFLRENETEEELEAILEEAVHDVKSSEASEINSRGVDAQLKFLLETWGRFEDLRDYFVGIF